MPQVVAISAVTVDINTSTSDRCLRELEIEPGSDMQVGERQIEQVRAELQAREPLPPPASGGSVSNSADLLARANLDCALIGVGGDDPFGRHFEGDCKRVGLQLLYPLQAGLVTGYNLCFSSEAGKSTIVWTAGANSHISPRVIEEQVLRSAKLLVIDGFTFGYGENGPATIEHAANLAARYKVPYVLTLASVEMVHSYRDLFKNLIQNAYLIAGNLEQAAALAGLSKGAELEEVVRLLDNDVPSLLITLGEKGAWAKMGGAKYEVQPTPVDAIDTTGGGDAFLAGFLVAMQRGLPPARALSVGNLVAAEVVRHKGARLPYEVQVSGLIDVAIMHDGPNPNYRALPQTS